MYIHSKQNKYSTYFKYHKSFTDQKGEKILKNLVSEKIGRTAQVLSNLGCHQEKFLLCFTTYFKICYISEILQLLDILASHDWHPSITFVVVTCLLNRVN